MIDLVEAVAARMRAKRYPGPIVYGPEFAFREGFERAIVFERDREVGDEVAGPTGATKRKPRVLYTHTLRAFATVYARASAPGARISEHEEEVEKVARGVLASLYQVCVANRLRPPEIRGYRLLRRDELFPTSVDRKRQGLDVADDSSYSTWPGAALRIDFTATCNVQDLDYEGDGESVGNAIDDVTTRLVQLPLFPDYVPFPP